MEEGDQKQRLKEAQTELAECKEELEKVRQELSQCRNERNQVHAVLKQVSKLVAPHAAKPKVPNYQAALTSWK